MTFGSFRGGHPRVTLTLPGKNGDFAVDVILDTGFAGDLTLPNHTIDKTDGLSAGLATRSLASGQHFEFRAVEIFLDWNEGLRPTEILVMEGEPLLGTELLRDTLLQIEMTEGGEVSFEPI
jgi:predicted aspartyl protease